MSQADIDKAHTLMDQLFVAFHQLEKFLPTLSNDEHGELGRNYALLFNIARVKNPLAKTEAEMKLDGGTCILGHPDTVRELYKHLQSDMKEQTKVVQEEEIDHLLKKVHDSNDTN